MKYKCSSELGMVYSTVDPKEVLRKYRIIAVVGASKNPEKDANTVPAYLMEHGYTIIPVNPTAENILGVKAYPSLLSLPSQIASKLEVVNVFRPSEELPEVARQTVEVKKNYGRPYVFWAQLGLYNEEAAKILSQAGIDYVMDACMRIVHGLII
jgi:predicted CoA-binding protein